MKNPDCTLLPDNPGLFAFNPSSYAPLACANTTALQHIGGSFCAESAWLPPRHEGAGSIILIYSIHAVFPQRFFGCALAESPTPGILSVDGVSGSAEFVGGCPALICAGPSRCVCHLRAGLPLKYRYWRRRHATAFARGGALCVIGASRTDASRSQAMMDENKGVSLPFSKRCRQSCQRQNAAVSIPRNFAGHGIYLLHSVVIARCAEITRFRRKANL